MVFAHDTEANLLAAVALVNSELEPDTLTTLTELDDFFREHGYSGWSSRNRADLDQIRALRPRLRGMLTSDRDRAAELSNEALAQARAIPQLVRHDDMDWHVHAIADDKPMAERILVETAMAMVDVIRSDEMSRLAVCADTTCEGLVLDLSRNRSRRFCSTTCGNRNAVAAYRARQNAR